MVCEGYYEWKAAKTKKDAKQPYYIYATQEKGVKADDLTTWKDEWSEEGGWKGFKLLKMAGIFNKFKTAEVCSICKVDRSRRAEQYKRETFQGKTIYNCTMVTKDSNKVLSWLHNRVPVFLMTEEDSHVSTRTRISIACTKQY